LFLIFIMLAFKHQISGVFVLENLYPCGMPALLFRRIGLRDKTYGADMRHQVPTIPLTVMTGVPRVPCVLFNSQGRSRLLTVDRHQDIAYVSRNFVD